MLAIGCDVGGTNTRSALIDLSSGKILDRRQSPSPVGDYFVAVAGLMQSIRALQAGRGIPVGIAVAAQLDPKRQKVLMAPNLKWANKFLARDLSRSLGVEVHLENDVRAAARGELAYGALKGVTTGACVFWGSGIGGAVVAGGQVIVGPQALAGEVGHMTHVPGGLLCGCGKKGCFEAYAGGHALSARTRRTTRDLVKAGKMGPAITATACLLSQIVTLLDPERVVLGGGLGTALFSQTKKAMEPLVLKVRKGIPLVRPKLGDDAGLLGAATMLAG